MEGLFAYIFGIDIEFWYRNLSILTPLDSVDVASLAEWLVNMQGLICDKNFLKKTYLEKSDEKFKRYLYSNTRKNLYYIPKNHIQILKSFWDFFFQKLGY